MEQSFYKDRLAAHGLEVIIPSSEDRAVVHSTIYEELCLGVVRRSPARGTGRSSTDWWPPALKEWSWAAPSSSCSSGRTTLRFRSSRRPAATRRCSQEALANQGRDDLELVEESPESETAGHLSPIHEELTDRFPGGFDLDRTLPLRAQSCAPRPAACDRPLGGSAVGCGRFARSTRTTAEIKRMWIDPSVRGRASARRLLAGLESAEPVSATGSLRLDTKQPPSRGTRLYHSSGYSEIALTTTTITPITGLKSRSVRRPSRT